MATTQPADNALATALQAVAPHMNLIAGSAMDRMAAHAGTTRAAVFMAITDEQPAVVAEYRKLVEVGALAVLAAKAGASDEELEAAVSARLAA